MLWNTYMVGVALFAIPFVADTPLTVVIQIDSKHPYLLLFAFVFLWPVPAIIKIHYYFLRYFLGRR